MSLVYQNIVKSRQRAARRCAGCGHAIRRGDDMTWVRWLKGNELKERPFHADCEPPFDAARVALLTHPGFEFSETFDAKGPTSIRLEPFRADEVIDLQTNRTLARLMRQGGGFKCIAFRLFDGRWSVTTRGSGHGSTRHQTVSNSPEAAMTAMKNWFYRRFRIAEVVLPE